MVPDIDGTWSVSGENPLAGFRSDTEYGTEPRHAGRIGTREA